MTRPETSSGEIERIGSIRCPSGIVALLDGGLAWMWSHDRAPLLPSWSDIAATANTAVDLSVQGPDAMAAGQAFDRSNHPLFIYDIPRAGVPAIRDAFAKLVANRRFTATLVEVPERIPHRRRVDHTLAAGNGQGAVDFHGMWAAAARVPAGAEIAVMGERMPTGPDPGRWRRIWLDVAAGEVATSRELGHVLVDEARLLATDVDALALWQDDQTVDGLADLVFWGAAAPDVAREVGASAVHEPGEDGLWGWTNLPIDDAVARSERIDALQSETRKFKLDFRPHTHHWQLMRQVRPSRTESGVLDLGSARVCLFMTTWGDGAFPVHGDFAANGGLLRIRIEVGCDKIVQRQRAMEERWYGALAKLAFVSAKVARENMPVRFLYREKPDREQDSGWRIFAGGEDDAYNDDPSNIVLVPLRDLIDGDPALEPLFPLPAPCAFERHEASEPFVRVEDFDVDRE